MRNQRDVTRQDLNAKKNLRKKLLTPGNKWFQGKGKTPVGKPGRKFSFTEIHRKDYKGIKMTLHFTPTGKFLKKV